MQRFASFSIRFSGRVPRPGGFSGICGGADHPFGYAIGDADVFHAKALMPSLDWSRFLGRKNKLLQAASRSRSHGAL